MAFKLKKFLSSLKKEKNPYMGEGRVTAEEMLPPNQERKDYLKARQEQSQRRKETKEARLDYQRQREYEANKKIVDFERRQRKYEYSRSGRVSQGVQRVFATIQNPVRATYRQQIRPRLARNPYATPQTRGYRKRGRPYGTVKYVHPETGQPIGVYEYRKILSAQLRGQRMRYQQQYAMNPAQQQAIARMEAQQRYDQSNVEGRTIPDTYGQVNMRSIHQEADSYAHLFD